MSVVVDKHLHPPKECFKDFGRDLDGCSRQENEGCNGCRCLVFDSDSIFDLMD